MSIPRDMPLGRRTITLSGASGGSSDEALLIEFVEVLTGGGGEGDGEPHSIKELASGLSDMHRDLGIEARFRRGSRKLVYRSSDVSFEGRVKVSLRVLRARR